MKKASLTRKQRLIDRVKREIDAEFARTFGHFVSLTIPKHKGRIARIEGVIFDERHGFLYLCMVMRRDGAGLLDSDGWTRSYRPDSQFEFVA